MSIASLDTYKQKGLRKNLIAELRSKGISDEKVLKAMGMIPRHRFIDATFQHMAYEDVALRINESQTISQPYTVAFQTEVLEVASGMKVLEIGTGSGYQACVLAELGVQLVTIERFKSLHESAKRMLLFMSYNEVICIHGDGYLGYEAEGPYDRIIVTAAAPGIPDQLIAQLKDGGKMVIPVDNGGENQQMLVVTKEAGEIQIEEGPDFRFVPMVKGRK